ncbi:MAG: hypothetical protein K0R93_2866 [Anaerosolibacter sp.]|jgi:diguanylate cyclase (GGDEF)-like protein/PAS domain S-box-containing protein|uniref:bifunctional diguanylate cyclase/phosphodiesterase n=1 Tax=Anaerosolibacter sp. TaxID=1872527 RepID=UPI0026233955|nr:bifunctional diguanylate cyclase/phosphodiesterase [Anaerosolibacter sp.]MDF2547968.1 hypothetical protein [Anaerosolibacter sp.]
MKKYCSEAISDKERNKILEKMSEYQYACEDVFLKLPDAVLIFEGFKIVNCNTAALKLFNYEKISDMSGMTPLDISPLKQPDGVDSELKSKEILQTSIIDGIVRFEWLHKNSLGKEFPVEVTLITIDKVSTARLCAIIHNTTKLNEMNAKLRESQAKYKILFENNHAVMLIIDPRTKDILDVNEMATRYYGYSREELLNLQLTDLTISTAEDVERKIMKASLKEENLFNVKHRLANKEVHDIEVYSGPIEINGNRLLYLVVHDVSQRIAVENELKLQKTYFKQLFENSPEAIAILDTHARIIGINKSFEELFLYQLSEIVARKINEVLYPTDDDQELLDILKIVNKNEIVKKEVLRKNKLGKLTHVELLAYPISSNGNPVGIYATYSDITERKQYEEQLKVFAGVYNHNTEGIIITDMDGSIEWVNKAFTKMTGFKENELKGNNPRILKSGKHDRAFYEEMWYALNNTGKWQGEIWNRRKNGTFYLEWLNIFTIDDQNSKPTHYVAITSDITEQKKKEEMIEFLAFKDNLTELYNRSYFIQKLEYEIAQSSAKSEGLLLMFLDLDGFKRINDNLGHLAGDEILRSFSQRLRKCVTESDVIARIGGDEFVIMFSKGTDIHKVMNIGERIIDSFKEPFDYESKRLYLGASIGISVYPDDALDAMTLIKHADIAMYEAKNSKGSRIKVYSPALNKQLEEDFTLENYLRHAMEHSELFLIYQPIVDTVTQKIVGVETLVRWQHPQLGIISPLKFIPIAEKNGMIIPIGEWILREACKQNKKWQLDGYSPIFTSVNISVHQLESPGFSEVVKTILEETGLEPKYLELEITETVYMENLGNILKVLEDINQMGIKISIDDFGTGYSSLGQLKRLDISKLKIDKSFIQDIYTDTNNTKLVSAIISMAKSLNLDIVAEGVEKEEQCEFLKDNCCSFVQGYLFSKPASSEDIKKFLKKNELV